MTTSITLRATKGSALTHSEMDTNLTNLQTTADQALAASDTLTANKAEATALGVANTDQNMGSFTGTTIADNVSAKVGMQSLETAVETKANATAVGVTSSAANMGTYTGTTIPDNETAKQNLQTLETAHETLITDLAATGGAALIGANDASSGSLYTTVQGFLTYLLSSAGSAIVGFIQSGTGATASTLQAETRRIAVYPEQFGAVGDGVTDDTTALTNWISNANKIKRATSGASYLISSGITFAADDLDVDMQGSTIKPSASSLLDAVTIGSTSAPSRMCIRGISIDRTSTDTGTENNGFVFLEMNQSTIEGLESRFSKYNFHFKPTTAGCGYNNFQNLQAINGYYNWYFNPSGTGWTNENVFIGGRCFDGGTTDTNIYMTRGGAGVDHNTFIKPSVEGSMTQAIFCNGTNNVFISPRTEGTMSLDDIVFGPTAEYNKVIGPRQDLTITDYSTAGSNTWQTRGSGNMFENGTANRGLIRATRSGANATQPVAGKAITGLTAANPAVVTSVGHGLSNGNTVMLRKVGGMTNVNGKIFTVANVTADTFELSGTDSSAWTAYTSGGYIITGSAAMSLEDTASSSGFSQCLDLYAGRTGATSFYLRGLKDSDGTVQCSIGGDGSATFGNLSLTGTTLGFFNTAATTKKTVTGSRGGNAALASLLTHLAAYGLITDSSS